MASLKSGIRRRMALMAILASRRAREALRKRARPPQKRYAGWAGVRYRHRRGGEVGEGLDFRFKPDADQLIPDGVTFVARRLEEERDFLRSNLGRGDGIIFKNQKEVGEYQSPARGWANRVLNTPGSGTGWRPNR